MGLTKKANMINAHKQNNNVKQTYLFDKHSNNSTKINTQNGGTRTWWGTTKCEKEKIPYTDHEDIFKYITEINFAGLIIPYYNDNIITESVEKLKKFGSIRKYNRVMCVIKRLKQTFIDLNNNTTDMTLYQYNEAHYRNIFIKLHIKKQYVIMLLYIYVFYTIYNSFDTIVPSNSMQLLQKKLIDRVNTLRDKAEKNKDKQLSKREKLKMNYKKISNYFDIIDEEIKFLSNNINSKLNPTSKYNATQLSVTDLTIFLHNLIFTPKISDNILATMNRIKQQLITDTATPDIDEINARNKALANATAGSALVKQNINLDDKNIILIIQNYIISYIINVIIKEANNLIDTDTTPKTSDTNITLINNIINILYNYAKNTFALDSQLDLSINTKLLDNDSSLQSIDALKDSNKKQMNITQNLQYYTIFYKDFMQTRKDTIDLKIKTDSDVKNRFTNARTFLTNFILLIQKDINITLAATPPPTPPKNIIECIKTYDATINYGYIETMYNAINNELNEILSKLQASFTTLLTGNDITETKKISNEFNWLTTIKYAPILPPTDIEKEKEKAITMLTTLKTLCDTQDTQYIIKLFNNIYINNFSFFTSRTTFSQKVKKTTFSIDTNALIQEDLINTKRTSTTPDINTTLISILGLRTLDFSEINGEFFSTIGIFEIIAEDVIKQIKEKLNDNLPNLNDESGVAVVDDIKYIIRNDQLNYVFKHSPKDSSDLEYKHILDSVINQTCGMNSLIAKTDDVLKAQERDYYRRICASLAKKDSLIKVLTDEADINNTFKFTLEEFINIGTSVAVDKKTKVFPITEILSLYNSDTIDIFTNLDKLCNSIGDVISNIQKANVK